MKRVCCVVALGLFGLQPVAAKAHPLAPSVLSFEPSTSDRVTMQWRAPAARPTGQSLKPKVPDGCVAVGAPTRRVDEARAAVTETVELRCERPDMLGSRIVVDGFEDSQVNVVLRIVQRGGRVQHAILGARNPAFTIAAPPEQSQSLLEYLTLGVEHLVTGWDHLTFVLGLLILFGWHRRLIAAVTAFTLGHSLTLALSVLGIVRVPQAVVEALIAMTIVVLALEIQSSRKGPVWRHPWILPGSLGLLHGLGFASVLFGAGLPSEEIPLALFGFNLGLELGQLAVIALAGASFAVLGALLPESWRFNRTVPAYLIGSIAAFWMIERTFAAFGIAA